MKKKLIFCVCMVLCVVMCMSTIPFSAFTFDCDVEVTSAAVLVANLDTDTFVYEKNSTTARYLSYLSGIMTFIVARNNISDISTKVPIKAEVLNQIEDPDNSIDIYTGKTLTVKDLLHYILLTDSTDACFVLADYVSNGDIDAFVELMNKKARDLGCTKTKFSSPACVKNATQYTTCSDLYKIVKCALDTPDYTDIAATISYIPDGYKSEKLAIGNTNSLLRQNSPYYFKHVKNGKYGQDDVARGNIVAVSEYSDVHYVCIVLGAENLNEHNAFTETKQLLTWAYTTLGNKQILAEDTVLTSVSTNSAWGESSIGLVTSEDIVRTMPADYDESKLEYEFPDSKVKLPVFEGQNMGTAKVYYEGKLFDEVDLVSSTSQGITMLGDLANFADTMFKATLNLSQESVQTTEATEAETQKTTSADSTQSDKAQTSTQAEQ